MATTNYECGCSITRSMFGEREVLAVRMCSKHARELQVQMEKFMGSFMGVVARPGVDAGYGG